MGSIESGESHKHKFITGAAILGVAAIVVKIAGAFFRIPLANIIGPDGMAYYQAVYSVYVLLYTIATLGVPVAISKLISEKISSGDQHGAKRIFMTALSCFAVLGLILFLFSFVFADNILSLTKNLRGAVPAMRALSPTLLFVTINTILRGYFQGMQNMKPTALSQIVEQVARVLFGLFLAIYLLPMGKEFGAAGATFGACAGAFFSLLVLAALYIKEEKKRKDDSRSSAADMLPDGGSEINLENDYKIVDELQEESRSRILKSIFAISIPVSIGALVMPLMNYIDTIIVTNRLSAVGYAPERVRELFGELSGFVTPVVSMPEAVITAIAISIVPAVAVAKKAGNSELMNHNVTLAIRITAIIGFPCTFGMVFLAKPIMMLLFSRQADAAAESAGVFGIAAIGLVFLTLASTLTGILQGLGKQHIPVINLAIGAALKIMITYILTGSYTINIKGAAIGTVVAYATAALLNLFFVLKHSKTPLVFPRVFGIPLVSSLVMGLVCLFAQRTLLPLGSAAATAGAILIGGIVYVAVMFLAKGITKDDLAFLRLRKN